MKRFAPLAVVLALALTTAGSARADEAAASDTAPIRHLLMSTFDKPDARLAVDPIVVVGPHAIAGWAQGERGGRALLHRQGHHWQITLCAGDGLKDPKLLQEAGIAAADAKALTEALATAEAPLPAAVRARFASFDGVLRMDAGGSHPPAHKH